MRILVRLLRFVLGHELAGRRRGAALLRLLRWQLGSRLTGLPALMPFVGDTRLPVRRGLSSATANLYVGLADFREMGFVLHLLRPGDLMGDVGAHIGVYTVLAAGVAGAEVVAVEPTPSSLLDLHDAVRINDLGGRVSIVAAALGDREGTLRLTAGQGAADRVLGDDEGGPAVTVAAATLDSIFADRTPLLLKLDVEGYEARVLAGGIDLLARPGLCAVLVETGTHGARYDGGTETVDRLLRRHGFAPFEYDPARRHLTPSAAPRQGGAGRGQPNTLYLRNPELATARVGTARAFTVLGERF